MALDNRSKEERSRNMAAVKNKDTDIELILRKSLWREGLRYRVSNKLPGRPDIVFLGRKLQCFVMAVFGMDVRNVEKYPIKIENFGLRRLKQTRNEDQRVNEQLTAMGWKVLRYWGAK